MAGCHKAAAYCSQIFYLLPYKHIAGSRPGSREEHCTSVLHSCDTDYVHCATLGGLSAHCKGR